jgi:beta-xylosidase
LVKVEWVHDWPVFNNGKNIELETEGRDQVKQLVTQAKPDIIRWEAALGYGTNDLELGWYQKNTPLKFFHSLTERPGYLRIHGGCYDLSSPEAPSLLLRKQESFHDRFSATMEFNPSRKGYEAGISVWWSMYSFASIGITCVFHNGEMVPTVVCRQPSGVAGKLTTTYPAIASQFTPQAFDASAPAQLSAQATPTTYTLELLQGQSTWAFSFNTEDLCVMPPVGGAFTGTMFGIYSFGDWEPVLDPADFKYIVIRQQGS